MPVQLFMLRGVPDDESEEIRELLNAHDIAFYETPAGNWGVSAPAIWLNDEGQLQQAKRLIEQYQKERLARVRAEYEQLKRDGKNRTVFDQIKDDPVRLIGYLIVILTVLYLSTKPFLDLGK
ncbi:DUF6164 family protein [Sulfurirhabdus autotrophica]|uniref:Signal transducing protein n=2 Tax=Sulfurirhabdus autotrophica TaxID=1706046 RepID=A0A4R3YEV6_9PROT|nr:DUF6164 family protein [Sulfurirhabdus autotrophica]TCV89003.1 hypothetical protein EDC63_10375 [Sulfurirhabdus autotrophica]